MDEQAPDKINTFMQDSGSEDGRKFIELLNEVAAGLEAAKAQSESPSHLATDAEIFRSENIKPTLLQVRQDKVSELKSLGLREGVCSRRLTIKQTSDLISLIRAHINIRTEAGIGILVKAVLLHLVSNLSTANMPMVVVPAGWTEAKPNEGFMVLRGYEQEITTLLQDPDFATKCALGADHVLSNIYVMASDHALKSNIANVVVSCVSYCRKNKLSPFRGCLTTGELWRFFAYNADDSGEGCDISLVVCLEEDLSGLPLILGLLTDCVMNSREREQQFLEEWSMDLL